MIVAFWFLTSGLLVDSPGGGPDSAAGRRYPAIGKIREPERRVFFSGVHPVEQGRLM